MNLQNFPEDNFRVQNNAPGRQHTLLKRTILLYLWHNSFLLSVISAEIDTNPSLGLNLAFSLAAVLLEMSDGWRNP